MKHIKYVYVIITSLLAVCVLIGGKILNYNNYPVHISIDDVDFCMRDITRNKGKYHSLFEQPFWNFLREMNKKYGVKFTLYLYAESDEYIIDSFPDKYRQEFINNSNWLKLGYHSKSPVFSAQETAKMDSFKMTYRIVDRAIDRFAGSACKSKILRLHYFYATKDEVEFLSKEGINTLLTADNVKRKSYSLSDSVTKILGKGAYSEMNMHYLATDLRIENFGVSPMLTFLCHQEGNDTLVVFTHEWALDNRNVKNKLERLLQILYYINADFIN